MLSLTKYKVALTSPSFVAVIDRPTFNYDYYPEPVKRDGYIEVLAQNAKQAEIFARLHLGHHVFPCGEYADAMHCESDYEYEQTRISRDSWFIKNAANQRSRQVKWSFRLFGFVVEVLGA